MWSRKISSLAYTVGGETSTLGAARFGVEPARVALFWTTVCLLIALRVVATPFVYQGRITDGTLPANGSYEFTFRVYDSLESGAQVGSTVVLPSVGVTNGIFTVSLDFGEHVFTGANRWLEMAAKPFGSVADADVFVPRQAILPVPYAQYAAASPADAATAALAARVSALESVLASGITVTSVSATNTNLTSKGFVPAGKIEGTGWGPGSSTGVPTSRYGHSGVWTGSRFLIWGGLVSGIAAQSGSEFDPEADAWAVVTTAGAPAARSGHTAVWTGDRMLVWGGSGGGYLGTGAAYSPSSQSWTATGSSGVPAGRSEHVAVWTGARMVVFGGRNATGLLSDGAAYDPVSMEWLSLPSSNAPAARRYSVGVWTGTSLVIFGGEGVSGYLGTGAKLSFADGEVPGAWQNVSSSGAPSGRVFHSMVWTGSRLVVWGGKSGNGTPLADGAAYDPSTDTWSAISASGAPSARHSHVAVWTGFEMLVFGGETAAGTTASGGAYDPATDSWRPLTTAGSPVARSSTVGVWTGSELLVFGGLSTSSPLTPIASLQRLNPQPTWYLFRKP